MAFEMGKSMTTSMAEFYKIWLLPWFQEVPCREGSRYGEMVRDILPMASKLVLRSSSKYAAVLIICLPVKCVPTSLYSWQSLNAFY